MRCVADETTLCRVQLEERHFANQKQELGEELFPQIEALPEVGAWAAQITGMILEKGGFGVYH